MSWVTVTMKRTTLLVLLGLPLIIIALAGTKALQIKELIKLGEIAVVPPVKVTYLAVEIQLWPQIINTVASLEASQGVDIAAELAGKVTAIDFKSGQSVVKGQQLIAQDISTERAQLKAAKSALKLAENKLKRIKQLKNKRNASQSSLEDALADVIRAEADIEVIQSTINKKLIKAPFTGQLGIRKINVGQELAQGAYIVSLQQLDPMLVNFNLPQRYISKIKTGLNIDIQLPDNKTSETISGTVLAIDPKVDNNTRNLRIQAKINNPKKDLLPGMFVNIVLDLQQDKQQLVVPTTAIRYAPYGNSVFVIDNSQDPAVVKQQIVEIGETRGDYIAIDKGLKGDEIVVTSGAFKLSNGQTVELDNSKSPTFKQANAKIDD